VKKGATDTDLLPPHSPEAERGVLGCVLADPKTCLPAAQLRIAEPEAFYCPENRLIWMEFCRMGNNGGIDLITLMQHLRDDGRLTDAGGAAYLSSLPDTIPSPANLPAYLDIVTEKFTLRRLIKTCTETVSRVYGHQGDLDTLLDVVSHDLSEISQASRSPSLDETWTVEQLLGYDVDHDPNAVVGWHEGRTTRYLCKGYGAWLISQSGIGKSTLAWQQSICLVLNRPFCGICPVRPLRVLIVQSENDIGDNAETLQGIADSMPNLSAKDMDQIKANLKVIRCRGKTGSKFCQWLEREVVIHRADVVYVDPLLRFAGIEVSRQDQVTQFLNNDLDPVLARTGVVMIGIHHTGKPKGKQETKGQTIYDMAYSGIGSSELVNWARAITIIEAVDQGAFRMILSKRGNRAFAQHPDGTNSIFIYLKHSTGKVYWEQTDPPLEPVSSGQGKAAGRKSKVQEVATSNLHDFCAACKTEGEGKNEIATRIEVYLAKHRNDVSTSTCKRIIEELVANGKLLKNEAGLYVKGLEA
jgi:hypothetical protein